MIPIHCEGAAREAICMADLISRGFEVFHAFAGNTSFDIVAYKYGFLLRIEVKGMSKFPRTSPFAHTGNTGNHNLNCKKCDIVAGVEGSIVKYARSIFHEFNPASKELVGEETPNKRTRHDLIQRRKTMVTA
jgi:hypothetical protein